MKNRKEIGVGKLYIKELTNGAPRNGTVAGRKEVPVRKFNPKR